MRSLTIGHSTRAPGTIPNSIRMLSPRRYFEPVSRTRTWANWAACGTCGRTEQTQDGATRRSGATPITCKRRNSRAGLPAARGVAVADIIGENRTQPHQLSPFAKVAGCHITYPARKWLTALPESDTLNSGSRAQSVRWDGPAPGCGAPARAGCGWHRAKLAPPVPGMRLR